MNINLNGATPNPIITQQDSTPAAKSANPGQVPAEDSATLSIGQDSIDTLTSQAMASSELRSDKIEALRQSIAAGQYKVEPDKVAEAILGESERPVSS